MKIDPIMNTAKELAERKVRLERRLAAILMSNAYGRTTEQAIDMEAERIETLKSLYAVEAEISSYMRAARIDGPCQICGGKGCICCDARFVVTDK